MYDDLACVTEMLMFPSLIVAGCTCPVSGACLSANQRALVSAATRYSNQMWFTDLYPKGFGASFSKMFYMTYEMISRPFEGFFAFKSRNLLLTDAGVTMEGYQCHFKIDNNWEPEIMEWKNQFKDKDGFEKWSLRNESTGLPKQIHMKLTTDMMTNTGFTSFQSTDQNVRKPVREREPSGASKQYIALSGGGWRALSSHMGTFRGFSNTGILETVTMFSSVSGGSWTLSNLAFNANFSHNVLRNDTPIGNVVLEWMEAEYFAKIRNTMCFQESGQSISSITAVGRLLSTAISEAPDFVRSMLGSAIVAINFFDFSWQNLVEQTVLDVDIARQPMDTINLAPAAKDTFGDALFAYNWNHLNRWNDANASSCSKWYLKEAGGAYLQYPVYTTALYKQHSGDGSIDFKVEMRGKPINGSFDVCYAKKDDFCLDPPNSSSYFEMLSEWVSTPSNPRLINTCDEFNLGSLTLGQVVSASSAAAGGAAVDPWVQSIFEMVRQIAENALGGSTVNPLYCSHYQMIIEKLVGMCNKEVVVMEALRALGCETSDGERESVVQTAKRWARFLGRMAIRMTVDTPFKGSHSGDMAIDAVCPPPHTYLHKHLHIIYI